MEEEVMLGVIPEDEGGEIELQDHRAIITLPEEAVEATINIKVFHDGDLIKVHKVMNMGEIRQAFKKADDGYIDDDDTFVLTEKGKAYCEEHGL